MPAALQPASPPPPSPPSSPPPLLPPYPSPPPSLPPPPPPLPPPSFPLFAFLPLSPPPSHVFAPAPPRCLSLSLLPSCPFALSRPPAIVFMCSPRVPIRIPPTFFFVSPPLSLPPRLPHPWGLPPCSPTHRSTVWRSSDDPADTRAAGRVGLARPVFLWPAGGPGRRCTSARGCPRRRNTSKPSPTRCRFGELLSRQPVPVLLALGASIVSNSSYYLLLYIPTYGIKTLHLPASTGFIATLVGGIALAVFSPIAGHWPDKTRHTRIMLITAWLMLLSAYPVFYLMVASPSLATAIFAVGFLNLVKAGYSGVLPSMISEQFPVETRAVGVAFSYSISVTIFGGFAPFFATWLIAVTGDDLSPAYYLMATAILSIIALMAIQRRSSRPT